MPSPIVTIDIWSSIGVSIHSVLMIGHWHAMLGCKQFHPKIHHIVDHVSGQYKENISQFRTINNIISVISDTHRTYEVFYLPG